MLKPSHIIPPPSLSPYGTLTGDLFQYSSSPSLVAFESSPPTSHPPPTKCILLGGLSDGLLPMPYTLPLQQICHKFGWSLVQPILSSSYLGFGTGSLTRDTKELDQLMTYLKLHRGAQQFALVGHSTGCQNSVHFCKYGNDELVSRLKCMVLQGPVSDRESCVGDSKVTASIHHARQLISQGKQQEMMPRDSFWAPITAERFVSLHDKFGEDDFFSSDLTDEEMESRLGHIGQRGKDYGLRVLVAFSGKDEYVPDHVNKEVLLQRLCRAMNSETTSPSNDKDAIKEETIRSQSQSVEEVATGIMLETGNHSLSKGETDVDTFMAAVAGMIWRGTVNK